MASTDILSQSSTHGFPKLAAGPNRLLRLLAAGMFSLPCKCSLLESVELELQSRPGTLHLGEFCCILVCDSLGPLRLS